MLDKNIIGTRWRKVLLDLWSNKTRTILVVLAIAVGVFAVGMIAGTRTIVRRELSLSYDQSNAAAAVIYTQPFDDGLVRSIERIPGVEAAEGRRNLPVRIEIGPDKWQDGLLTAIGDYDDIQIDKIWPEAGEWPPGKRELLLERKALVYLDAELGDTLLIELADGTRKEIELVGLVHDAGVPDTEFADLVFGYVSLDALSALGDVPQYTELRFTVDGDKTDMKHIKAVMAAVEKKIEKSDREVLQTSIPTPGEHWAEDVVRTLMLLLGGFGALSLFLSGFLVINTINAIMTQHIKQIGIMKMVGAERSQIMGIYFVMTLMYGILALLIAVPLGGIAARAFILFITDRVNVNVSSLAIPPDVLALEIAVGLLVPLVAALWPVISGAKVTTHAALNDTGLGQGTYGQGFIDRQFMNIQQWLPVPRPMLISLRNTIRRKGRLTLTLFVLTMSSAFFISVLSVRESLYLTIDDYMRYHQYDVSVDFDRAYRTEQLEHRALQVPGVTAVESWMVETAYRLRPDGVSSEAIKVIALPPESAFINPKPLDGRWLLPDDTNAVVIDTALMQEEADIQVGDEIVLDINGRETLWRVVGVVRGLVAGMAEMPAYINYDYYTHKTAPGKGTRLLAEVQSHESRSPEQVAQALTHHFETTGFYVGDTSTTKATNDLLETQLNLILTMLLVMVALLAVVGSLGLTTTMSINVLERTREIGVMRALGASDQAVRQVILVEGIFIALLSWLFGTLLAFPLSKLLSDQIGIVFLGIPFTHIFTFNGALLWFLVAMVLAVLASLLPARKAARLTIREVLAYE